MLRVTLGGEQLTDFPPDQDGAYVKLHVPSLDVPEETVIRTYTVRFFREDECAIDVDFVLHDVSGPAAAWAGDCKVGEEILVGGPGPKKPANHAADWFLFAGDMSALPAISANLESLPRDANGYAFLEIMDEADKQTIDAPCGIAIQWLINPHPERTNSTLFDAVEAVAWRDGAPYAWVAGEFTQSLNIRALLRERHRMARKNMYASSYWQIGKTEDGHRVSKAALSDS